MKRSTVLLPNVVTTFSLACGLFVIFKMSLIPPSGVTYHHVLTSVYLLMLAAFLDFLDGMLARVMKIESDFGGVFDSLADAVSFGVAPPVIILKTLAVEPKTMLSLFLTTGAFIYSISGILRLVRFTVTSYRIQGDAEKMANAKANFTGLPITAAWALVTSMTLFFMSDDAKELGPFSEQFRQIAATISFVVVGYFMISRWKFPSLKTLRVRVGSFQVVLATAFFAACILIGAMHHFSLILFVVSWSYLIVAFVLSIVRRITGKKLEALADFEMEELEEAEEEPEEEESQPKL